MKRILNSLLAVSVAVGFACFSIAEVQNVRVTGDIRARVNYSENIADLDNALHDSYGFVNQRTRVGVGADLTEGVSALVEMGAEGDWGISGEQLERDDESMTVRLSQAYFTMSDMFGSPVDMKAGRQYLNYGRGFLISDNEQEYHFDAAKLTTKFSENIRLDTFVSRLVQGELINKDMDLFGVNLGYYVENWNVETYFFGVVDKTEGDQDPLYYGLRGDVKPVESLDVWGELTYEDGTAADVDLKAWAFDAGAEYTFQNIGWTPALKFAYTFAQGDDNILNPEGTFVAPFNYTYYGYVFSPLLNNIHILNARLSVKPLEKLTLSLDYYHFLQDQKIAQTMGNPDIDNGGVMAMTNGTNKALGNEIDLIASYMYTKDVATKLLAGWFVPGKAYSSPGDDTAFEIRGEIVVNF